MSNIVVSIWLGLLRVILTFLHLVYSGLQYFDLAWALFKRKVEDLIQLQVSDTELYVSRFVTNLEKCPSHLAVIVGSETINIEDFSNIVIWCLAAGISFVSFYDHTGFLRENETAYFKHLMNKRKPQANQIIINTPHVKNGITKNGFIPKIHVNMLSIEDGKQFFVKFVEHIGKKALTRELHSSNVGIQYVNEELHKMTGYPDPDIALVAGNVCSTFGFLPWQIRITEFVQLPTLHGLRVSDFTTVLKQYSRCQQRFGK